MFERLRKKLTLFYSLIFGVLILIVVTVSYTLVWYKILNHEKQELIGKIYHEAEEYVNSGEPPVSANDLENGDMLAYFESLDGSTVILDQLQGNEAGKVLYSKKTDWPVKNDSAGMLRIKDGEKRYKYLAAVATVKDGSKVLGRLYMFKNMEFYYTAAKETLLLLSGTGLLLFMLAAAFGFWLAGRNIRPVENMYLKQKEFTADASHEMRTPISVITLAAEGLAGDEDSKYSSFAKEMLKMLKEEAVHLRRLTEELMELARSDSGRIIIRKEVFDINILAAATAAEMQLAAGRTGCSIISAVEPGTRMYADRTAVKRLLIILIDNAVKYAGANAVIKVSASCGDKSVLLQVADNGPGIKDPDKKRIFDRFFRVDKARSRNKGGFGLGLSLAAAIAAAHKGRIWAEDNTPSGTVMKVLFPQ